MAGGKAFNAHPPHKHGRHGHPHSSRYALGLLLLAVLALPVIAILTISIYCWLSGSCSSTGWALVPSCLSSASDSPAHGLDFHGTDTNKWRNFLRSATSMPQPSRSFSDPSADDAAADSFPPDQWQPWELPPRILQNFPNPENAKLDPSLFHLHIKFLTFDRVNTTLRCLNSLLRADYEGDAVSLEIFLDHPYHLVEGWRKMTAEAQKDALQKRRDMLELLDSIAWPHGPKKMLTRSLNAGIQPQWMEAFWPENVNEFAFIVEDDTEVSPYFYIYLKRLIMHYYYTKANFNPLIYGISFQRQWFVPAKGGNELVSPPEPFLYQLVGTWGQIVFPIPWKDFRVWYDVSRYTPGLEPILENMVTTIFWHKKGNSIWTHWQVHWVYARHYFNLYTGFPGNLSLSVCHRTAGVNIKRTLGPDTAMITRDVLHDPSLPASEKDAASGLPLWWTSMPNLDNMKLFDFCFRQFPNWRRPVSSFEELQTVLPIFNATNDIAVLPVPDSTSFTYKLVRNWLCHLDGTAMHNYLLLMTLRPLKDDTGKECLGAAQHNAEMMEMAADLAERNHLVYLQEDLAKNNQGKCIESTDNLFLSRVQGELVRKLLQRNIDTLVLGVGSFWRVNPFVCFKEASARHRIFAVSRLLKAKPDATTFSGSLVWVDGSTKGVQKWHLFMELWDKFKVPYAQGLPVEAVDDALKLLHGLAFPASNTLSTKETKECAVAAPWEPAKGAPNTTSPAVLMAPVEDTTEYMKKHKLWELHDTYNCCLAVKCNPYV